jgi:hypothetical protein
MVAVSAGWVSGGGALVAVPEQQLDATGTYTVCYNFRGLGLLSITDLVVVSGAVAFRTVGSLGQYQSFSLIVDGAGLSTADRYALVANATADCFELTDLGTLILAGQLAGSTQVNIPTLQMGAGLYRVCYQLGTNVARQVPPPPRNCTRVPCIPFACPVYPCVCVCVPQPEGSLNDISHCPSQALGLALSAAAEGWRRSGSGAGCASSSLYCRKAPSP